MMWKELWEGRRACVLGVSPTYHLSLPRGGRRQARSWRLGELGELGDGFGPEGVEKLHVNGGARNIGEVCMSGCGTIGSGALAIPTVTLGVAAPWIASLGSSSMMRCIVHN